MGLHCCVAFHMGIAVAAGHILAPVMVVMEHESYPASADSVAAGETPAHNHYDNILKQALQPAG